MLGDVRILARARGAPSDGLARDAESTRARRPGRRRHRARGTTARHRAQRAAGAVRHDPPLQDRLRRRAAQAHDRARPAVADRPRIGFDTRAPSSSPRPTSTQAPLAVGAVAALAVRSDVGIDLLCDAADTERLRAALLARGALAVSEQAAECLRVERGRPRYGLDIDDTTIPQEAGAERARGQLHEGLLRRPGDGRAPALQGQAQPPSARAAAVGAGGDGRAAAPRRAGRRPLGSSVASPQLGLDRAGARAARG